MDKFEMNLLAIVFTLYKAFERRHCQYILSMLHV